MHRRTEANGLFPPSAPSQPAVIQPIQLRWLGLLRITVSLFIAVSSCFASSSVIAQALETEVYRCRSRSAEELRPLADRLLGTEGRAVADRATNVLVLRGEAEAIRRTIAALSKLDRPRQSLIVRFESVDARELDQSELRVRWRVEVGNVRVGRLVRRGSDVSVRIDIAERELSGKSRTRGQLRILDGETGRISLGSTAPIRTRTVRRGPFGTTIEESVQTVTAESGFEATPVVVSQDEIELTLRRFRADPTSEDALAGSLITGETETRIRVAPGETVVVAETRESQSSFGSSGPFGSQRAETTRTELLLVSVEFSAQKRSSTPPR